MTNWQPSEPEWLRVLRELRQRVAEAVTPWLDVGAQVSERLRLLAEQLPSREEFESFIERFNAVRSAVVSPNCEDLETGEMVDALELMRDEGLNLAWAPHANLIRELVAAEDAAARERLLVDRTDDVLRDLTASLEQVTQPLLSDEVVTAHEAIASYRAGRHRATQALAGVLVGALIEGRLGMTFAKARGCLKRSIMRRRCGRRSVSPRWRVRSPTPSPPIDPAIRRHRGSTGTPRFTAPLRGTIRSPMHSPGCYSPATRSASLISGWAVSVRTAPTQAEERDLDWRFSSPAGPLLRGCFPASKST